MAGSLRRVGVIAWAEARRGTFKMDRKTVLALSALSIVAAVLAPTLLDRGFDFNHGLYTVAVGQNHPLYPALTQNPTFVVVTPVYPLEDGTDVLLLGTNVYPAETAKGQAAAEAVFETARAWGVQRMLRERDQGAAFPIRIETKYEKIENPTGLPPAQDLNLEQPKPGTTPRPAPATSNPTPGPGGSTPEGDGDTSPPPADVGTNSGGFDFIATGSDLTVPSNLAPPFPFRSLILAYLFLIPMNFVVQGYASSIMGERLQRKGEVLLASPSSPLEIVAGKTIPYALSMLAVTAGIAWWIGAGPWAVVAMVPVVVAFLALEFCAAVFARSFRELTFLTVFVSVSLTIYCFLPAVFTNIHPVALISPITLVVMALRGETIGFIDVAFSITPLLLVSFVSFYLGLRLYTEEDLFHQKPVKAKIVDALAKPVHRPLSALKMSMLLTPFVFVAQLLLVTGAVAWGITTSVLGVILLAAVVEEVGKSASVAAAYSRGRLQAGLTGALLTGAFSGLGFFLAEKIVHLASIVGLLKLNAGAAVFALPTLPLPWYVLLFMPLALHVVTAAMTAVAASQGRRVYVAGLVAATGVHALYNYTVLKLMGVGA